MHCDEGVPFMKPSGHAGQLSSFEWVEVSVEGDTEGMPTEGQNVLG